MKKIWQIYRRDLYKISRNLFAMIIVAGIIVIPALYAWFNINSNWDPYSNTKGIKIAVANTDKGDTIEGLTVNVGGMIVDKLASNDQIGWQFVSEEDALAGVDSSEYYAALIIPEDFSKDILSITNLQIQQPSIDYYVNEKKNAIAPKITNAGVSTVQLQVNQTFIETASSVVSTLIQNADSEIEENKDEGLSKIMNALNEARDSLSDYDTLLSAIVSSTRSLDGALAAVDSLQLDTGAIQGSIDSARQDAGQALDTADSTVQAVSSSISSALSHIADAISDAQNALNSISVDTEGNREQVMQSLNTAISKLQSLESLNASLLSSLQNLQSALPSSIASLDRMTGLVSDNENRLNSLITSLQDGLQKVQNNEALPDQLISEARQMLNDIVDTHNQIIDRYENSFSGDLASLGNSINEKLDMASGLVDGTANAQMGISDAISSTRDTIQQANSALTDSQKLLQSAQKKLDTVISEINSAETDEKLKKLSDLLKRDPSLISAFLKQPVSLESHSVYKIANYGSGMAPFYTTLAIWVGALVNVAILKTRIRDENEFGMLTPAEAYFGRYLLFMTVSILQALVICLGDLYMLHIQCLNPGLFILSGVVTAITFSLLMYTLTISFGDVGKAIAVILMVIQVAGSGGTFPIETLPSFYQSLYPFFPFNFAINSMRECVGGLYGNVYWMDLLKQTGWIAVSLGIGLVLRRPIIHMKDYIEGKIEETGLMG